MALLNDEQSQKNAQRAIDRIITLIGYRQWGNLTVERFRTWKGQFDTDTELHYAIYLAQQLTYYSKKDILSLISFCIAESVKSFLLKKTESIPQSFTTYEWKNQIEETRRNTLVCPLFIDSPAASGYMISRMLRDQSLISEDELCNSYQQLVDKLKIRPDIKGVIFVDDMMGSGTQAKKAFNDVIILDKKEISLKRFLKERYPELPVAIAVAVTPEQTLHEIETELDCVVVAGEVLNRKHDVLDPLFWGEQHFESGYKFLLNMKKKYNIPLTGHGSNAWAVSFEHGTPDNTSPFYIASPKGWTSLIRYRGEDV